MNVTKCGKISKKKWEKFKRKKLKEKEVGMDGLPTKKNSVQIAHERAFARQYGR